MNIRFRSTYLPPIYPSPCHSFSFSLLFSAIGPLTHSPPHSHSFIASVLEYAQQDPRLLSIGGNTGTTDSFTGLDPTNFTNGIYNAATLAEGNNLQCFIFQLVQAEAPGVLAGVYGDLTTKALEVLRESVGKSLEGLGCPELRGVEGGMYERFPG